MLPEGQQLSHYRLVRLLKSGGMGEVYLAEDTLLHRQVAIKVIQTDFNRYAETDATKEAARLFLREAQAIAQLDQINILPLYDSGEEYVNGTTLMYMVMPYRREGSLKDWLRTHLGQELLPLPAIERIVRQAAFALQHAHDHQIIHQDVKPSNFLVHGEAEHPGRLNLQLADFGVSKLMMRTSQSQVIRGTPMYMAPEQWEGHPAPATDQYALAVMAYELLTGHSPFVGNDYYGMWYQHHHVEPRPPSVINPKLPKSLDAVLLRALAKNPENRYSSVSAFAYAFQSAIASVDEAVSPSDTTMQQKIPTSLVRSDVMPMPPHRSPRKRQARGIVLVVIAFVLFLLLAGGISVYYVTNSALTASHTAATATAVSTTATATITGYPPYLRGAQGTFALDDPLNGNNEVLGWDLGKGTCNFTGGALDAKVTADPTNPGYFRDCIETKQPFINFAYEVKMAFVTGNSGDCGGVTFRGDLLDESRLYYYYICQDGRYGLVRYTENVQSPTINPTLRRGNTSLVKAGAGQTNLIAVVAQGFNFDLYVNRQYIDTIQDTTYSGGIIGVLVKSFGTGMTEVLFNDARVWTF